MKHVVLLLILLSPAVAFADPGKLPDPKLTPGVARDLTLKQICTTKWGKDQRAVTAAMKRQVFAEYGLSGNTDKFCKPNGCEVDHRIPREIGGADDIRNLWIQSYSGMWNAHQKDRLENLVHKQVCSRSMTVEQGRAIFLSDWAAAYKRYFGDP